MNEFPATVEKKVKLLNYFRNYMKEHLLKAGANMEVINKGLSELFLTMFNFRFVKRTSFPVSPP